MLIFVILVTPVGSQTCFQKMVIIKSYFKSTKEHPLGKVVSINEGRKSVSWYFMILNAVYLHPFLFFIQILCQAKLQGLFSLRFDQVQNSFQTIVKNLNQFEEITYLLTEFHKRGKYKVSFLPWPTFVHKNVVFLKLCMPLFNEIIIEKEK